MTEYSLVLQDPHHIEILHDHPQIAKVGRPRALHNRVIIETDMTLDEVRALPGVVGVERGDTPVARSGVWDGDPDGWALPWISNSAGTYEHEKSGAGVDIYVLDEGIMKEHADFRPGQVETIHSRDGLDYYDDPDDSSPWHGTSVASCAAGQRYGVARGAHLLNLRVQWTVSGIIRALDVALRHHLDKPDDRPSVLNFSGSSLSSQLGDAFADAASYGVVNVAAAGNNYEDQPRYPARALWTLAVGALKADATPAGFSNKRCQVWAPGHQVRCASLTGSHAVNGTSFAAPLIAGLIACNLQGSHKFNRRSQVSDLLWAMAQTVWERGRVDPFDNGGYPIRTASTRVLSPLPHYLNPSFQHSDAEINWFVNQNLSAPQTIADACLQYNVSLKRLVQALQEYTAEQVDDWFASHGVTPWWYVGA